MSDMPEEVKAWRSIPLVDHCGTWSETRYPEEAIVYIRADLIDMDVLRRVEAALEDYSHYLEASEETNTLLSDLRAMMEKLK